MADPRHLDETIADSDDLSKFGYRQAMRRTIGGYGSFSIAFSIISIVTAVFFLFPLILQSTGGVGIWLWIPVFAGIVPIILVYSHIAARIPLTGGAYQWNSRLASRGYGWFSGWTGLVACFAGTASIGAALAGVFSGVIWGDPTPGQKILFAGVVIAVAGALNLISSRLTALVNNAGVTFEIGTSVVASAILIVGVLFFFPHAEGFSIVTQVNESVGDAPFAAILAAATIPLVIFVGWEGAADIAEETHEPRRATPRAMIRASILAVITSFVMVLAFGIAIPHGVDDLLAQTRNPLFYIFAEQLGPVAGHVLEIVVFIAIFSCLLANIAVASRLCYSLARDRMLPGASALGAVSRRTHTPILATVLVCVIAFSVNLLSEGLANNIVSIGLVAVYTAYGATMVAALIAVITKKMPAGEPGGFGLGRWLVPLALWGVLWALAVMAYALFGQGSFAALEYFAIAQALGIIWYVAVLRRRLATGRAGIPSVASTHPVDADEGATTSASV